MTSDGDPPPQWSPGHQNVRTPTRQVRGFISHPPFIHNYCMSEPPNNCMHLFQVWGGAETGVKTWKLHVQPRTGKTRCCFSFQDDRGHVCSPSLQQELFFRSLRLICLLWCALSAARSCLHRCVSICLRKRLEPGWSLEAFFINVVIGISANHCANMSINTQFRCFFYP